MFRQTLILAVLLPLITALPKKSPCSTDADCDSPLSCLGNPGDTRCFQKKPRGMRCALDPFWVCEDGLVCQDRVCKVPVKGECNTPASICADGLDCLGNPGKKKCAMKKGPGMKCGKDPFWICQDGLVCDNKVCKTPVAGECNTPGTVCADGLDCLGNPGKKRCEMKKGPGMRCGNDPFWVCQDGLICLDKKCKDPNAPIPVAGKCNDPTDVCEEGLSCVGNEGNKKCFMKKGLGMRCGQDPFWVCQDGLTCTNGRCSGPIGTAGSCNDPADVCAEGLSCVGNEGNKKCFMKKQIGMRCGQDPFWVCQDKLACVNDVCRKTVGRGKRCGKKRVCKGHLICAGPPKATRCVRGGKLGKPCGDYQTCRGDYTCLEGICIIY